MSHAPHAFQPPAPMPQQGGGRFNPRAAVQPVQHAPHATAPQGYAPHQQGSPYGAPPVQSFAPYPAAPQPQMPVGPSVPAQPLSKKEARRAAKAQKAAAKAQKAYDKQQKVVDKQQKVLDKQHKLATRKRSPIVPFILGLIVGMILTTYLSNILFASEPLEGPAWTLPSEPEAPFSDALPDEGLPIEEGGR